MQESPTKQLSALVGPSLLEREGPFRPYVPDLPVYKVKSQAETKKTDRENNEDTDEVTPSVLESKESDTDHGKSNVTQYLYDKDLGNMIADAYNEIGKDGKLTVENSFINYFKKSGREKSATLWGSMTYQRPNE